VSFVITGIHAAAKENDGDEDLACADYIEALLGSKAPDTEPIVQRVLDSYVARMFHDPARPEFPAADLKYCVDVDRFDFAMRVVRQGDLLVMNPI
jgi:2-phosphosulfolactate phosphatase